MHLDKFVTRIEYDTKKAVNFISLHVMNPALFLLVFL